MLYSENLLEGNRSICSFVASHKLRPDENVARNVRFSANFSNGSFSVEISLTKLLQKSGIRKNEVIELIYRGFI